MEHEQFAMIHERDAMEHFIDQSQMLFWLNVRRFCLDEYMLASERNLPRRVYPCMLGDFVHEGKMFTMYWDGYVPVEGWQDDV